MRINFCLDINIEDADPGKHKFFIRLAHEMKKRGIKISSRKPDVYIFLPGAKLCETAKLNIVRLDNVVLERIPDVKKRNKKIKNSIYQSNALIYQSNFSKLLHNKFLGIKDCKKSRIIFNGASSDEFLPRNVKNYFLASAKWRPCKRLSSIVESFLLALDMGLDSDLIITGKAKNKVNHPRIKYLTWQNRTQLKQLLSGAIASLHLTWLDCCPNSMIEAMVAGCPVIYAKSGGIVEIVKNSGIGIKDKEWNFRTFDSNKPPEINKREVALAMLKIKNEKKIISKRKDLYISEICNQYISFFEELLQDRKI